MSIDRLLSTAERLVILDAVIFATERLSVNILAERLTLSKALVSRYLDLLVHEGLGRKVDGKFVLMPSVPVVKGLRIVLTLRRIPPRLFTPFPFVRAAGLYGSGAKGENTDESDLDLWLRVTAASEQRLAALTAALRKHLGKVNALILSETKLRTLKADDPLFYHALSFGSIVVYGTPDALEL